MDSRYRLFRFMGYLFLIAGCFVIVVGSVLAVLAATGPTFEYVGRDFVAGPPNPANGLPYLGGTLGIGGVLLFISQLISIIHGIEENTRASSIALRQLISARSKQSQRD